MSEELLAELKEIVLEIRQYLCNTEFAPEPFTKPVDLNKLTVEFPNQILAKVKQHYEQKIKEAYDQGYHNGSLGNSLGDGGIYSQIMYRGE